MSFNRLQYDDCSYQKYLKQSSDFISHLFDPVRYERPPEQKCRMEFGVIGATNVSHVMASMVDVENDLRGQTRPYTKCPKYDYVPDDRPFTKGVELYKLVKHPEIPKQMKHLPTCDKLFLRPDMSFLPDMNVKPRCP